jgi:dephospho-CoA kinase
VTVLDVPLLFESGMDKLCDITVAFIASKEIRLARIINRDGITKKAAEARIAAQPSNEYYKERADYVIENNGEEKELEKPLSDLFSSLMR